MTGAAIPGTGAPLTEPELFLGYGAADSDPAASGHRCPMCGTPDAEDRPEWVDADMPCSACLEDMREGLPMP